MKNLKKVFTKFQLYVDIIRKKQRNQILKLKEFQKNLEKSFKKSKKESEKNDKFKTNRKS